MLSFIEKSGTGSRKGMMAIEKSGTGIEKSGTGIGRFGRCAAALVVLAGMATQALAADPEVLVTAHDDQVFISVHASDSIFVGRAAASKASGYYRVALYQAVGPVESNAAFRPLVAGSGSGSSKEVAGSGSGSSTEVAGSGSGSSTEVAGSGSGSSGEACLDAVSLLVAGSGSGSSTEVAGSGSGSSTEVAGSGSGSAGDAVACAALQNAWGLAEVVVDRSGTHVLVHQIQGGRMQEYLLAFLPGSESEVAHSLYRGSSNHGFIAVP